MSWLDEAAKAAPSDMAALADLRERFPVRRAPDPPPPSAHEVARQELAARLRNVEVLVEEVRDVVDAAGEAATVDLLQHLADTCAALEVTLSSTIDAAAESAGLVAT